MNMHVSTDRAVIQRLRAENEELRERVRQLEVALAAPQVEVSPAWKLTPSQARVYRALARDGRLKSRDQLFDELGLSGRPVGYNNISVHIYRIRQKIKPFGGLIETQPWAGYRLAQAPRANS